MTFITLKTKCFHMKHMHTCKWIEERMKLNKIDIETEKKGFETKKGS